MSPILKGAILNERNNEPLTAPKKNGGGSANINSCATNKVWWV